MVAHTDLFSSCFISSIIIPLKALHFPSSRITFVLADFCPSVFVGHLRIDFYILRKGHTCRDAPWKGTLGTLTSSSADTKWKLVQFNQAGKSWIPHEDEAALIVRPNLKVLNNCPVSLAPSPPLLIQQEKEPGAATQLRALRWGMCEGPCRVCEPQNGVTLPTLIHPN